MFEATYKARLVPAGISTDDIIPARYKHMHTEPAKLAPHVFENRFPGMAATFAKQDAIVCAGLFGIGSSREQAVSALQAAGVGAVLAPAFGRIFFRNAWNLGLPAIEVDVPLLAEGKTFLLDLTRGVLDAGPLGIVRFKCPSQRMLHVVAAGGLLPYLKSQGDLDESVTREVVADGR